MKTVQAKFPLMQFIFAGFYAMVAVGVYFISGFLEPYHIPNDLTFDFVIKVLGVG